jgi:hypothetical protein
MQLQNSHCCAGFTCIADAGVNMRRTNIPPAGDTDPGIIPNNIFVPSH